MSWRYLRPWRRMRAGVAAVALALVSGCAGGAAVGPPATTVWVNGTVVTRPGLVSVADALRVAHTSVPSGVVLSARDHHRLRSDGRPGAVLRNGIPVPLTARLHPGDRLRVVAGADIVEPVQTLTVAVPSTPPTPLFQPGRPGRARVTRGSISGEIVRRVLLRAPGRARLIRPGAVTLTFDDGPDPRWTPRILRLLRRARVQAVFCVIGRQARRYPNLIRQITGAGNVLCNQTWNHDLHLADRPDTAIRANLRRTNAALGRAGTTAPWFRAPGGGWSPRLIRLARAEGLRPLTWTVDPRDWTQPPLSAMQAAVRQQLHPGGVLLLHDGGGDRARTVQLLTELLRDLPRRHYRITLPRIPSTGSPAPS